MKHILSIDSNPLSNKVLEGDIKEYFEKNNEPFEFYSACNIQETFFLLGKHTIDILLIDISSKKYDGLELLKDIKNLEIQQPKVIAVTVLEDRYFRFEALKLKVFRYIYKPYDNKEIHEAFDKFFDKNYYAKESNREKHFINIQDIENPQEISYQDSEEDKKTVEKFKETHQKMSASEFLDKYESWGISTADLDDLEMALERVLMNIIQFNDPQEALPDIIMMLETYNSFLYMFNEFDELSKVVYAIIILLRNIDFETISNQVMVSRLIITTLQDLVDWKEGVFVEQNIEDVYYINDAILNSYVQIQDLVH